MKRFEDRSPRYRRRADNFVTYGLGGVGLVLGTLLILAFLSMVAAGAYAVLTRVF